MYYVDFCNIFRHLSAILNISKSSMMPRWHHSDSSSERYQEVKSIKTFNAALISRSHAKSMFGNWTNLYGLQNPLGPTPESRKSTQPKRVPAACLFYTEMCIFGHICPPISRKPEFCRHSGACGLRVPPLYCKTH